MYSDLAGEERFASIVAKRLKSLGAVNLDNHRSLETVYSKEFNLETEYGQTALNSTAQAIIHHTIPSKTIPPPSDYQGQFFSGDIELENSKGSNFNCLSSFIRCEEGPS